MDPSIHLDRRLRLIPNSRERGVIRPFVSASSPFIMIPLNHFLGLFKVDQIASVNTEMVRQTVDIAKFE